MYRKLFFILLLLCSERLQAFELQKNAFIEVTKDFPAVWELSEKYPETTSITIESPAKRLFKAILSGQFESLKMLDMHSYHTSLNLLLSGSFPQFQEAVIEATSGDISVTIGKEVNPKAVFTLKATSGDIRLRLDPTQPAKIKIVTQSGTVNSGSLVSKSGFWSTKEYVTPSYEESKPHQTIELKTTSGDINISI